MARSMCVALGLLVAMTLYPQTAASQTTYLSLVNATYATIGWGSIAQDAAVMRGPLRLNGVTYARGIGTHAASDIRFKLDRRCSRFDAVVGVDDYVTRGTIRFRVWADGVVLHDSGIMTGAQPGQPISVDVSGRYELRLVVTDGGDGIGYDHADWADARVTCTTATTGTVTSYLSDITAASATIGWGSIGKDVAVMRGPLRLNGVTYAKGIGTHAASDIRYKLDRRCTRFQAVVGVDDYVTRGSIRFQVWADGSMLFDSGNMTGMYPGMPVSVDVTGRYELRLLVTDGGDGIGYDHADWADAKVSCSSALAPPDVTFAYWNLAGGDGKKRLAATNLADPAKPFSCTSTSGTPVDDSVYGNGTGAAILQSNGAMTEALRQHVGGDPKVVALGVSEAWGGASVERVVAVLGWQLANASVRSNGAAIVTRYGFTEQAVGPVIGQTGAEIHRPIYANVCLDKDCTRTMPMFAVHTQNAQGAYDGGMATLLTYVDSVVPAGRPRIVIGDFNAWDTLTDPHLCVGSGEPGASHEAGIRRIKDAGYTSMLQLKNPTVNRYTGMLNVLSYSQTATSCIVRAGLPQGHPYKAIDHAFSQYIADADVVGATKFAVPIGGFGNCAASDHLGIKVTVKAR